jgi:hypothetical protein
VGVKTLRVEKTEGPNYLDYLHQEMRGMMGEVSLRKSFQHRMESRRAARARSQSHALLEMAGHQARIVDEERKGVPGSKSGHS